MKQQYQPGKPLGKLQMKEMKGGYAMDEGSCTYSLNCGEALVGGHGETSCTSAVGTCDWVYGPTPANGGPRPKIGVSCDGKSYRC